METYEKKLCMTEFSVQHVYLNISRFSEASAEKSYARFIYIERGSAEIRTFRQRLSLSAGNLFYIPVGMHETVVWKGAPDIEYYSMNIVSSSVDTSLVANGLALQSIPSLSTTETGARVREIFRLMSTGERIQKLRALSLYYALYADALTVMKESDFDKPNPVLLRAIEYIESHFTSDITVEEIADACFISASRLHHIFLSVLDTTPIRYRNRLRIERAAELLRTGDSTLDSIASKTGFNSSTYFRRTFHAYTGLTPTQYRIHFQ